MGTFLHWELGQVRPTGTMDTMGPLGQDRPTMHTMGPLGQARPTMDTAPFVLGQARPSMSIMGPLGQARPTVGIFGLALNGNYESRGAG